MLSSKERFSISACAALALFATAWPAFADEVTPKSIGPNQPIMTNVGAEARARFLRSRERGLRRERGGLGHRCQYRHQPILSSRVRMELKPGQSMKLDTSGNELLGLKCGDNGKTLTLGN